MATDRLPEALALAAAAGIMASVLFVPPVVGIADDGGFPKVTRASAFDAIAPENDPDLRPARVPLA